MSTSRSASTRSGAAVSRSTGRRSIARRRSPHPSDPRLTSPGVSAEATPADLESRVDREKSFYNEKGSTSYHRLRRWIWRAIGEFRRNEEVHRLYDARGKVVLDYGCGPGYMTRYLIEERGATYVTGIDISEGEIERARERARKNGLDDRSRFVVAEPGAVLEPVRSEEHTSELQSRP